MKVKITENQLKKIILKEGSDKCLKSTPKSWNTVNYSLDDIKNGKIIKFGDYDPKDGNAIKLIQTRLNDTLYKGEPDGKYGKGMLEQLSFVLDIDLCKQQNNTINVGPNALKLLGIYFDITPEVEEDYLLTTTLVGENVKGTQEELNAILSTIKNRAIKCGKSMKDILSIGKQYSTLNYYNSLSDKEKKQELYNRVLKQKLKPKYNHFDDMFKKVQSFRKTKPLPYNHYAANYLVKKYNSKTDSLATSYKKNKKSSTVIGDHTFWWDDKHRCN